MKLHFALVGNQNCGKSTLFNYLTGSNQHVGNFPGVTVQKKEGTILAVPDAGVIDLPGIYSLSPYTSEEIVTRDLLLYNKPDAIINVIDATNIERSLYLSLQLIELNIPMVIALNMMDELTGSGGSIDIKAMEDSLTVPVVPITANSGEGVGELLRRAVEVAQNQQLPQRLDFCSGPVHTAIHSIAHLIETKARRQNLPLRFTATKLIEGDSDFAKALQLSENECDIIGHFVTEMEQNLKTDKEAALADMRYAYIEDLCAQTVQKPKHTEAQLRSVKIDHYLTHKFYAIPIFVLIMGLVFWLTFDVIGAFLSDILSNVIDAVTASVDNTLTVLDIAPPMHSLIIDGIFSGVGAVLSFLPTIVTLFFFLSMLEDSGYMARVAFVMDKMLRKIGLSGSSFVPMIIGFGCSVPAIMASRTLASERDRKMTIMLTPFMSCSAKLPIYGMFIAAFFPVLLATVAAVADIDPVYLKVARNFGIGQPAILTKIVFPAIFPRIATGLHLALGTAWIFLVTGEMVGAQSGLGFLIIDARNNLRADLLMAAIITIGVLGLCLDSGVRLIETAVNRRWGVHERS